VSDKDQSEGTSAEQAEKKERRAALREQELRALSPRYSPALHVLLPSAWGLFVLAGCLALLRDVRAVELLTVPVVWLLSNMAEWRIHRDLLHKRSRLAPALYDRHTPIHHMIYVHDDMEIRTWRELKFILIPAWAGVALFVALLPIAAGLWLLVAPNVALLFLATCMSYVVTYELLHMSYHLPKSSRIGRHPLIRILARHHSIHHDPRLMQKYNMNVTIPLWDVVRRTRLREVPPREAAPRDRTDAPAAA
jgi:ribosomal protein L39E